MKEGIFKERIPKEGIPKEGLPIIIKEGILEEGILKEGTPIKEGILKKGRKEGRRKDRSPLQVMHQRGIEHRYISLIQPLVSVPRSTLSCKKDGQARSIQARNIMHQKGPQTWMLS